MPRRNLVEFEWDPYYSNTGYYIELTEKPITEFNEDDREALFTRPLEKQGAPIVRPGNKTAADKIVWNDFEQLFFS